MLRRVRALPCRDRAGRRIVVSCREEGIVSPGGRDPSRQPWSWCVPAGHGGMFSTCPVETMGLRRPRCFASVLCRHPSPPVLRIPVVAFLPRSPSVAGLPQASGRDVVIPQPRQGCGCLSRPDPRERLSVVGDPWAVFQNPGGVGMAMAAVENRS